MQESRLFKILYHLLEKGQATAPELAERFEVSVRTIYRDIDALSGAGIPVYAEAGRGGGIRLMKDFVLGRAVLSGEEKQEILAALQSLHAAQDVRAGQTLQKLSALFQLGTEDWLEVDFSRWGNQGFDREKFELLKSAVLQSRVVRICYANSCGQSCERVVQPYKLVYRSRAWYLSAFCTERQDWRLFKLNRILELAVLEDSFARRPFPAAYEPGGEEYPPVVLRFPKEMAHRVYDEFEPAQVRRQENGDFVVSAPMPVDAWLAGFLLSFGTRVDILFPASLKVLVAEQAKEIYEKYKT